MMTTQGETDIIWDTELYHEMFFDKPNTKLSNSNKNPYKKNYLKVISLTTDKTSLEYKTMFQDRIIDNNLKSNFLHTQENLNGITTINQQGFQTTSDITSEEIVTTITVTTQKVCHLFAQQGQYQF